MVILEINIISNIVLIFISLCFKIVLNRIGNFEVLIGEKEEGKWFVK